MCMKVKLPQTKWVLVTVSSWAQGSWQTITSGRPLSLTRRTMMGSVTGRDATLHRREVVRYVGQVLSHERFFRYGQRDAGFSCRAAGPLQFGIVLRPRRLPSQGNGLCILSMKKGIGAE
jgi:hypothetical protein